MPEAVRVQCDADANMTSTKWSTGARASKKITMPTQIYPGAATAALVECGLNGQVQLLSSGSIMMKGTSGIFAENNRIHVTNKFAWLVCG